MSQPYVEVVKSVSIDNYYGETAAPLYDLAFEKCIYHYEDGSSDPGYRFMWYRDGLKQAYRGQARIPDIADLVSLLLKALSEGMFKISDLKRFI